MTFSHFGPFPFDFLPDVTNPGEVIPVQWSLEQAVRRYWKLKTVQMTFSATLTLDVPGEGVQSMTFAATATLPRLGTGGVALNDATKLDLCAPGADPAGGAEPVNCRLESAGVVAPSPAFSPYDPVDFAAHVRLFQREDAFGASTKPGEWPSDDDPQLIRPAVDAGFSMEYLGPWEEGLDWSLVVNNAYNPYPGTSLAPDGTFTGTLFGDEMSFQYTAYGGVISVDSISLEVVEDALFNYTP